MRSKNNALRFFAVPALAAGLLIAACSTDDGGSDAIEVKYRGSLSNLDSSNIDSSLSKTFRYWMLRVDTADQRELKGECQYTAYLGDSLDLAGDVTTGLYTSTEMGNITKSAAMIRAEGIRLALDTSLYRTGTYTHYRVDVGCE